MPIFEYLCQKCGAVSEYLIGMKENESIVCKSCGSAGVEKILSASAVLTRTTGRLPGKTCCGREERCSTPGETCCKT